MKRLDRIEKLEEKTMDQSPKDRLIHLGEQWLEAVQNNNAERAAEVRKKAAPIFENNPEYRTREGQPFCGKILFMNWMSFVNYNQKK